jgi:hypothetical protein
MERKRTFAIASFCLVLALAGCGSTKSERTQYLFQFMSDDAEYVIISIVSGDNGGENFLTRREDGRLVFSAKDADQDGVLDTVLLGDQSLSSANRIYAEGIGQAQGRGKYREVRGSRIYEQYWQGYTLQIQSFEPREDEYYNTFVHFDISGKRIVGVDDEADGVLDRIREGTPDMESSQQLYEIALKNGLRSGRIRQTGNHFVVEHQNL